jgi:hypothetical protein
VSQFDLLKVFFWANVCQLGPTLSIQVRALFLPLAVVLATW